MDGYVRSFMAAGGSLVMLAKGNRSVEVTEACREFGGFSLGTIGGAAPPAPLAVSHFTVRLNTPSQPSPGGFLLNSAIRRRNTSLVSSLNSLLSAAKALSARSHFCLR